ncbi:MAG TPA: hypothetical protein VMX18_00835 [Candidatus Bipolaricaulota bacterium]|nr:hypothetical protein [Candidatus Bipolaricaulota bacterium]
MKHSSNSSTKENNETAKPKEIVKYKTGILTKIKTGCWLIFVAAVIAGGLYLYKFYQTVRAQISVEISEGRESLQKAQDAAASADEHLKEMDSAIEQGKDFFNDAKDLRNELFD